MNNGMKFAVKQLLKEKWLMLFWLFFSLVGSFIPAITVYLNKLTIDNISNVKSDNRLIKICIILLVTMYLVNIINCLIDSINDFIFFKIKRNINYSLQKELYRKLSDIPFYNYENSKFYDKVKLAQEAIQRNGIDTIKYMVEAFKNIISILALLGILININVLLPLVLLGSTIPGIVILFITKNLRYKVDKENSEDVRKYSYISSLFMNKPYLKEMNIFQYNNYALDKWSSLFKSIMKKELKIDILQSIGQFIGVFLLEGISVIFSIFLLYKISRGVLSIGDFVSLTTAITTVQAAIAMIGSNMGEIFEISIYNKAFIEILNYDNVDKSTKGITIDDIKTIEFRNVSFKYPNSEKYILNRMNLIINKGDKVAIVGENGAGKSTLVNLILGLYEGYEGDILVNNINLKDIKIDSYIKHISVILQDFIKYSLTLRENISLSNISKINNNKEITDNLIKIGLHNKVKNFDSGLETYLTKEYENGEELSGGQWQKIAIGRGVFKDSNIVILDEPTSALDPLSELEVFELFKFLSDKKTTITISHRLGITRYSNKIIVLENGRVIESGTHSELINLGKRYYELYSAQAGWYEDEKVSCV